MMNCCPERLAQEVLYKSINFMYHNEI